MSLVAPVGDFGLRGPPGRWRKGAPVEKLEGERTRVNSMGCVGGVGSGGEALEGLMRTWESEDRMEDRTSSGTDAVMGVHEGPPASSDLSPAALRHK